MTLTDIIKEYQSAAEKAVNIFKQVCQIEYLLEGWHKGVYNQTGKLEDYGIMFYAFHGIGLEVYFKYEKVDFDFEYLPEPRHDGFDLWRLKSFVENQPKRFREYLKKNKLEEEFNDLIKHQIIVKPSLKYSTTLYFFSEAL